MLRTNEFVCSDWGSIVGSLGLQCFGCQINNQKLIVLFLFLLCLVVLLAYCVSKKKFLLLKNGGFM